MKLGKVRDHIGACLSLKFQLDWLRGAGASRPQKLIFCKVLLVGFFDTT